LHIQAQQAYPLSIATKEWIKEQNNPQTPAALLVAGDSNLIKDAVLQLHGRVQYCLPSACRVDIPIGQVEALAETPGILRIEGPGIYGQALMDTALLVNRIAGIHAGTGLPGPYTGKDVIIGIIDDGIYFNHGDFLRDDSSTRVRYIWDQNRSAGPGSPLPYAYGREWSWIEIDNGQCNHVEQGNGHGTNVTGIAAGDGSTNPMFTGVAPDAEIIAVSVKYNAQFLSNVADAVDYIFKKADALGRPCVINTSLGTYVGGRDGKDLTSRVIDDLLDERPGRALVAAGGNAREFDFHLGYEASSDTNFTWFTYDQANNRIAFEFWIDSAELIDFHYSFGVNSDTNFQELGRGQWIDFSITNALATNGTQRLELIRAGATVFASASILAEKYSGTYHMVVIITPAPGIPAYRNYLYSFKVTGSGRFDLWSEPALTGGSEMVSGNLPPSALYPDIQFYKTPDNLQSIVSSWQCSDHVLTVANFSNRAFYIDVDSNVYQTGEVPGALFRTSSLGPSRDGKVKPDLAATGSTTLSTGNLDHIYRLINLGPNESFKVALGGLHNRNGGTSMASPIVAGLAALYFEKNPNATWSEIKQVLLQNTYQDAFTGTALPNNLWGYGKVNGLATMQFQAILGCTDSSAFNYNPNANVDDGSCEPVIFGCLDSLASNFNPLANTADSCIYDTSTSNQGVNWEDIHPIYPNPSNGEFWVYADPSEGPSEFLLFEVSGKLILKQTLLNRFNKLQVHDMAPGLYLYQIGYRSGKLIIE
jgi:subtilisin family serine protease